MFRPNNAERNAALFSLINPLKNKHNSAKYSIKQPQISLCGRTFTSEGIKSDPANIQGILDTPAPKDTPKFSWYANFMQTFVPHRLDTTLFFVFQFLLNVFPVFLFNRTYTTNVGGTTFCSGRQCLPLQKEMPHRNHWPSSWCSKVVGNLPWNQMSALARLSNLQKKKWSDTFCFLNWFILWII